MLQNRKAIRLKEYDYSQNGAYFVTVCTQKRDCLFGKIINRKMELNKFGEIVQREWLRSTDIRREIKLDEYIVMPNHIHGIIWFIGAVGANGRSPLQRRGMGSKTLASLIAGFKSTVTKQINQTRKMFRAPVWQRNYYEHIIRDEKDLNRIREYIINNPVRWEEDEYYFIQGSQCLNLPNS